MSERRIVGALLGGFLALSVPASAGGHHGHEHQGLGDGRGIDHVGPMVRLENFPGAVNDWRNKLGFSATPPLLSPLGAKNSLIWFDNLSYFEILTFTERNEFTAPFVDFLVNHEGALFYGTEVKDFAQAITFLTGAGYPNVGPVPAPPLTVETTGQVVGLSPLWNSVILTDNLAPDNSNFFLDYDEDEMQQAFHDAPAIAPHPHANTAKRIDTLWLVVTDLDAAIDYYEGLGLEVGSRHERTRYLGGRGAEVRYKNATLKLLQPDGPGIVANFVASRGQGILGASVQVRNLHTAHELIRNRTGLNLPVFKDKGRDRFLVPTTLTHGFLLEMVE